MFEKIINSKLFMTLTSNSLVQYGKKNWKPILCVLISVVLALTLVGYFRGYKIEYYENEKPVFKMFYAKWCGYSQTALKEFNKCKSDKVDFEPIDCEADENVDEIKGYEINGYPTFYLVEGEKKTVYDGPRTHADIEEWVNKQVE
tara:strand:+ start:881 stop:1315 length:435 start_codon:yes stop_codon:yes gene_type:complete